MKIPSFRRGLRLLIALAFCPMAFFAVKAADPAPSSPVSNVTFAQRTDGSKLVDVRYTLTGGSSGIALSYSVDGGTTYSAIASATGDVGATVSAGTSKQIVWNAGTDYPNTSSANVRFRITPLLSGAGGSFAPIPDGTYQMGNLVGDPDITDAGTVSVTLSPYYMAVNDTTKAQWDAVRTWAASSGYTDLAVGAGKAPNHPVQTVSWYDAVKWANAASEKDGLTPCYKVNGAVYRAGSIDAVTCDWTVDGYRLPTEAEWEIAARGGLSGKRFPWGDTISHSLANYLSNDGSPWDLSGALKSFDPRFDQADSKTSPVGTFAPNGYGLYDMSGNVYQWCWNWYGSYSAGVDPKGPDFGSERSARGGDWHATVRIAFRPSGVPSTANIHQGFRLAKSRPNTAGSAAVSAVGAVDTKTTQAANGYNLYGLDDSSSEIVQIDQKTGKTVTLFKLPFTVGPWDGFDYNPADGSLYVATSEKISGTYFSAAFYKIDLARKTATRTKVISATADIGFTGIGFTTDGNVYAYQERAAFAQGTLYYVDWASSTATNLGTSGTPSILGGDYDNVRGTFWGSDEWNGKVYQLGKTNAAISWTSLDSWYPGNGAGDVLDMDVTPTGDILLCASESGKIRILKVDPVTKKLTTFVTTDRTAGLRLASMPASGTPDGEQAGGSKIFQDITPQVTGLTGYSSASLREVANANGAAPFYISTDNDVLKLYSQTAPFQFTDVSAKVLPAGFKWSPGSRLLVADFDNNGAQDLVLWEPTGLRVLLNTAGAFKDAPVPAALNLRLAELQKTLLGVLAADLDGDGDLDLVLRYMAPGTAKPGRIACVYNDGARGTDGRQSWAANAAGFARVADVLSLSYGYGGIFAAELNLDGKVDLIVGEMASTSINDRFQQRPLHLFVNKGSGVLEEAGTPITGMADSIYGFAFADYQGTGRLDLLQGSSDWPWAGSYPHAYWSSESGAFEKSAAPVLERLSGDYHFALSTADFDLDGRSDAFWSALTSWSPAALKIWRQTGPKTFQNQATEWGLGAIDITPGRTPGAISITGVYARQYQSTVADFDGDGAPDLLLNYDPWAGATQRLYRNNAVKAGANYLKIRLTGVASPRDGTGARIEVRTGSNVAVRYNTGAEQSNLPFGLGSSKTADLVKVYWPSGKVSEAKNVPGNQWLEVVEPSAAQFEVIRGRFTWPEALADAAKRGGRPAVLSTPELLRQANALQVGADAVSLWIGLSDAAVNGTFRWLDGTATTAFTNWSTSEPNDFFGPASENNVEMYANGKWNDLPGTFPLPGYLLERTSGSLRITKQPESVAVNFAAPFSLSVNAEGAGNIAYQWFKDGTQVSGATSGSLTVSALTRSGVGTYWVVVSEAGKSLTSEKALVTMANPPPVPTDALLAWWPLDGNAIDQGPNAIHGTLTGPTAGTDRFNRTTRTLEFAGSRSATAFVDFGAADKLRVPGDSTVALWVKFADSDTPVPQILNFGGGQFELSTSTGRGPRAVQYTVGGVPLKGARLLETGRWHHVAAVRKAGRGFLYVNGRLDAEGPMAAAPAFGKTLNLGRSSSLYDGAFAGALDDLRLYGRALTSLEIEALGSQPDGGDILPPVIVQDPKSLLVDAGAAAQFAVRASGARGVLFYQWLKDGVELPGATSAVLTLPKVEARHTGAYACVVSDGFANVSSASATLGVTGVNAGLWQGLVGHWKLDGNGQDSSGFANHATMRGTPAAAADRFGSATGAFSFGGNGAYFEVGDRAAFDLNKSDATLSAWVKTSSAAESWLLSKMDPSKAGGVGIGAGAAATLSSQAVTYFKLSQAGGGYQRIGSVPTMNLVAGHVYEVSAVLPADFVWSFGDVFEFNPASSYTAPYAGIIEAVTPSTQAKAVQLVGDHVEFRYRFKSVITAAQQRPQFAFWRGARQLVEIGNIELKNITTGELLTPPLTSTTLTTQWSWDSVETVKSRTASIFTPFSDALNGGFTLISGGSFQMGDNLDNEPSSPVRTVNVDTFHIAQTEVTGAQWRKVRDWGMQKGYTFLDPHNDEKDDLPAVAIKWYDAVKWCNALSEMEGRTPAYYVSEDRTSSAVYRTGNLDLAIANVDWRGDGFRLPTEAEWEKAARGGLQGKRFPWGDEISQYNDNYYSTRSQSYDKSAAVGLPPGFSVEGNFWIGRFNPVKHFPPNGYGLYGMAGNINEWCFDGWRDVPTTAIGEASPVRVVRGSAAYGPQPGIPATDASAARVSSRSGRYAGLNHGYNFPGMRVVAGARKAETAQNPVATLAARTLLWGSSAPTAKRASDSAALGDNKWHLVTSVYDRKGKMTLYVDGNKRVETDITPADIEVSNEHPLLIGSAVGTTSITGTLDDVRWYNRALSADDVLALYRQNEVLDTDGDGLSDAYEYGWGRYEMVRGSFTWAEAKAHAEAKGGHLATITSEAEWQAIKTVVGPAVTTTDLWLGGTDEGSEGRWRWITGEKWNFAKWGRTLGNGQEPNGATGENVLNLLTAGYVDRPNGFIWNDWGNGNRCGYLFERGYFTDGTKWDTDGDGVSDSDEIKNGTDPTNADSGLTVTNVQNRYSVVDGRFTWKEAKADAEKRGGHLVTVASAAEWETIRLALGDKFNTLDLWMGATDELAEGQWKWVTGEPLSYQLWCTGEPNGSGNYMHKWVRGGNKWDDVPNSHTTTGECVGYILEVERTAAQLNLTITTQPTPVTVPAIGGTASFSVAATGLAPLTYQWKKDGVAISGADQATLSLKNVGPAQIGKYTAVVGDASGKTVTSNEAELAITGVNSGIWSGLVAYYPFNGNANDESGNGNHGTVKGAKLAADRFGSQIQSYEFDGVNSFIEVPDSASLRPSKETTVSAWINMRKLGGYLRVVSKGVAIAGSYGSYQLITGSNRNDTFHDAPLFTVRTSDGYYVPDPPTGQPIQQWVQICGTYDGQKTKLFYDGRLVAEAPSSGNLLYDASSLVIGRDLFYGQSFDGKIDDIRVYNRALSAAEVTALYDAEKALAPVITRQPVGLRMPPGSSGVLRVDATSATALSYQWQKDGADISGATSQELPLNNVTEPLQGSYRARVSNAGGAVFSEAVLVDVLDPVSNVTVYVAKNGSDTTGDGTQAKPFLTIGRAVKAAAGGSRILVGPGTYAERVEYAGKSLRLHSSEGAAATTLQGGTASTVVYIDAAAANSELRGFKITGGTGRPTPSNYGTDYYGGGVHCATTALLSDCIFEANGKGTPKVNSATFGGAIYSTGGKLQVVNCLIFSNYAWASGGASFTESGSIEFDHCTVHGNDATAFRGTQGGLAVGNGGRMLVRNSIVWGNTGSQLGAFGWPYSVGTEIAVEYSDIQAPNDGGGAQTFRNGTGNISSDPLFADAAAKNFALRTGSPALDKASPGRPKEKDGTAADMGWRADRFGGEAVTFGSQLFTDVTEAVRLPRHDLLAEIDGGQGTATDRLVRVADGSLQLWRVTGAFGYRDVTVAAGLPKDLLAPGFGGFFAVGDVDNNGAQDLVVWDASGLRVYLNTAGAFKTAAVSAEVNTRAVELFPKARGSFTLADLDNDGDLDVVFSYEETGDKPGRIAQFTNEATLDGASGRRVWLAADGFSGVQDVMTFPWQKPHFSVTDSNADGLPDLVVLETDGSWPSDTHVSHKAHVYLNNQGGTGAGGGFGVTIGNVPGPAVSFPHDAVMNTDKIVTMEGWVRGSSASSSPASYAQLVRYSDGREHKSLLIFGDGSVSVVYAWAPWPDVKAPQGSVKMDGLWHHVAFSRHLTGEWEIYVDGKTVASGQGNGLSDRIIGTTTSTLIAAYNGVEIDEVRWSNVDRYNGPFTPVRRFETDANAVLLVHFDEGSGTRVQDSGIKRQVGTMPAGASWKPEGTKRPERLNGLARYSIISGSYTFAEAQADAVARGGHLLTVSSATEWDAVLEELTSRATAEDLWLGAEYENSQWNWVTGETLSYTKWDGGAPGSGTAGVYSAKDSGSWKTAAAGMKLGYLLEWEPAFQEVEEAGLTAASEFSNFLSVDVDGDGLLDLVNGSSDWPSQSTPKVFYGNGDGTYRQEKAPFVGSDRYYHHVARVADIDLDGRMDGWWSGLHNFANLQARLWRGMGGGAFAEVGTEWGVDVGLPSGNLGLSGYLADWDGDGDLDLVASATGSGAGRYKVYRNSAADRGSRWLRVRLVGVESPRDGTGARVTVVSGDRSETQYVGNLSSDGSPLATQLLFGLGSAPAATQIVVTWPNGQLQYLNAVPAGQLVEIKQNTNVPDWLKFTEQPLGRTVGTGTLVVFSATAVGSGTISYQWLKDGAVLAGGTGSTYRIAATALTSVGDYQVVASNGAARAVSAVARLEVAVPPSIVVQPAPVNVVAGTDVVFAVDALGTAPLSYQWSKGTTVLAGKTGRTLSLPGVGATDVASYSVKVTNPAGSVTSAAAALGLLIPVQITKQPANVAVTEGAPIALGVTATGSPVLKYQWYRDSLPLAGGTGATFAVSKASALDAGSYSVSVSNPAGETSSTAARVVVNLLPRVLNVEENLSVKEGAGFALVAEAAGTAPLTYVWKKNGTLVAGQTAATLSVPAATLLDSGAYTVEVKNAVGLAVGRVATVAVQALPRVVTQPVGIDAVEGSSVVLSVAATGALPLGYQWYKDGAALAGQSAPVLSLSPLSAATHGGTYRVQVSNTVGRVFSESAVVAARPALRITTQPAAAELTLGARGTFSVVASGAAPLSYQWYKDGATLPFATDDTLSVASVGKYSIGDYSVVVKDRFGNALRSELAALTVAGEPSTYWKGLMAHWKFAGDTRDSTPFRNHGKGANVQVVPDRFGIASSALRFSGKLNPLSKPLVSQNVTVPHTDSLQPGERYTVVVWAKPEFAGETLAEVNPFMLGKRAGKDLRDSSYALGAGFGSGALDRLNGGGAQTGYVTGGTATLMDGQWQMYALTFDGGSLSLYRNGAKVAAQAASSSAVAANTGPLRIGSGSGDGYQEWFGCLDDIRIYNKVLSAAEVTALYTAENTPPEGAVAPAAIVVQPVGYKVPEGGPVTLRVEALGGAPLAYQWKRDGAVLSGATAAEYKIAAAAFSDEGSYTVEVSNSVSSLASVPAFLDVVPAVVTDKLYVSKTGNDTTGTGTSAAPFLTIAKAVQAARSGFQILVGPGTYTERVEYRGKTLVIESTAGPVDTVIQAPAGNTAVFIDAAALNSELRGFKISGGTGRSLSATASSITFIGGGFCILTSAVVQDCIIENNGNAGGLRFKSQASYGGGVYSTGGTTRLLNCLILANHASEAGGAVFAERGTCELDRCTVFGNTVGNLNAQVGGLAVRDGGRLVVRNSIVRGNTGQQLGALPFPNNKGTVVQIEYSAIEGGAAASQVVSLTLGAGNISGDPLFVDVAAKNFALRTGSPALDAAAPGLPREADGTAADMGYRQDRFGGKTAQAQDPLFTEVTNGAAARLPEHTLLALVDAGAAAKVDRLVRVVSGKETAVRLWRAAGEFAAEEVTAAAGLPLDLDSGLVAVGDFDNNGAQDVVSWNAAGLRVYLSTAGVFKAQTVSAAMLTQARALWTQNTGELEVADLNGDGLLDLVCNYKVAGTARPGRIGVFLGSGAADATGRRSWGTAGGFTEFREVQSFAWAKPVFSLADVNSDGLADLLVLETEGRAPEDTGSRRPVHVYLNKWKTNTAAGASLFQVAASHGILGANELSKLQVVDVNGDGKLDLVNGSAVEGSADATTPQWFEGAGDGTFTARTAAFTAGAGVGHRLFSEVDADLDGVLDPVWLGADGDRDLQVRLLRGKGSAALQDMTNEWGVDAGLGAGRLHLDGYFSDWDGDGALDLVVRAWDDASTQGLYKVYRNLAASRGGKAVRVRLEGVRSPRDGQGAVIELTAGGRKQVQYVGNLGEGYTVTKSFGLGTAPAVEKITVRWPSGTVQEVTTFGSGSLIEIKEAVVPVDAVVLLRLPQSVVAASGQVVGLACEAVGIGSGTLGYQWFKDGTALVGATKSSYDIAAMSAANVGAYTVRLSFGTASVLTPPATVEMAVAPTIRVQPQSVLLLPGQTGRFSVEAGGTAPFTYQWFKGGTALPGATGASLTVADVSVASAGAYTVKVSNGMGSVTSAVANLTLAAAPAFTVQPAGGTFAVGAAVVLTPGYSGTAPLSYQWYRDGASIVGWTAATLALTPAAVSKAGVYTVTVSNAFGSADSAAAAVQVVALPSILEQPGAVSVLVGQPFKLSVRTTVGAAQTFQWFKGTAAVAGATGAEYSVAAAQVADAGSYSVKVTNSAGTVQSVTVAVAVNVPPSITMQPVAVVVKQGLAATLSVVAQGSATLTYQWQKNGVNIPAATAATYAIKAAAAADAGFYSVKVGNAFGAVQSNEVEVSVLALPAITQQPSGLAVALDERVSFSVVAVGSGTLTYRWRKAGAPLAGATSASYTLAAAKVTDAGSYDVVVTNAVGSVTSSAAVLAVSVPPAIVTQPVGRTLNPGAALNLSVTATGTAPLLYQWSKDGQPVAGATAATYTVAAVQLANAGTYTVVVSNSVGKATSQPAVVSVNAGVTITTQPVSLSVNPGASATFSVSATGTGPLTYQWRKAGVAIPGATSATYTISAVSTANVASYDVVVGNPVAPVVSAVAKLALNQPVAIVTQPIGRTLSAGGSLALTVVATGTDPKTYQWRKDGVALVGGTAATFSLPSVQTTDAGTYTVVVSNVVNSVTSAPAVVQLGLGVNITAQPVSLTVNPGTLAVFSVTATGGGTLTYQWRRAGVNLAGGTSSSYRIAAVKTTDAGTYTVVVSNSINSVTSSPAELALNTPAAITTQPVGATINAGAPYTFRVVATGTAPLAYQWLKGGVAIPGATSANYTISSPGSADTGSYSVRVSNVVNAVTSTAVNLTVAGPPAITANPVAVQVVAGSGGSLTAKVRSTLALTYQWKKDGVSLSNGSLYTSAAGTVPASAAETTLTLGLLNASDRTPGSYTVVVTNAQGNATSTGAAVTVSFSKPKFLEVTLVKAARTFDVRSLAEPIGPTLATGLVAANETLRVNVLASGSVTYAWRYTTLKASTTQIALTSQTGPSLDFSASGVNRGPGNYFCKVTSGTVSTEMKFVITSFGAALAGAEVSAGGAPLQIVSEPVSVSANAGGVVVLGVSATAGKRTFAWFREGTDGQSVLLSAGSTGFLRLDPLRASDAGSYFVVITDPEGTSVKSRPAVVTILTAAD